MHVCAGHGPRRRFLPDPNPLFPLQKGVESMDRGSSFVPHACTLVHRVRACGFVLVTVFQGTVPELGSCASCNAVVRLDSFRHRDALRAFTDGARRCQLCQDFTSAGIDDPNDLRDGGVVGVGLDFRGEVDFTDIAFLPFRYCPSRNWFAWEPRFGLRIARDPSPVDLWHELVPMADRWAEHQIRVREFRRADDSTLLDRLARFDLLVAPDSIWLDAAVDRFSLLACTSRLSLSTILPPDLDVLGPLPQLRSWAWFEGIVPYVPAPDERFSSLRTYALLAAFLERGFGPAGSSVCTMNLVLNWSMAQDKTVASEMAS